jgi:hypothetical protein
VAISKLPVSESLSTPWPVIMAGSVIAVFPADTHLLADAEVPGGGVANGRSQGLGICIFNLQSSISEVP